MKHIYFLIILFAFSDLFAQIQPEILWEKKIGGAHEEKANDIIQLADGNIIVVGFKLSDTDVYGYSSDFYIVKLNELGEQIWEKSFGGSMWDEVKSVVETLDGDILMAGFSYSNNGNVLNNYGNSDAWIVRLNGNGDIVWSKNYGGSSIDTAQSIVSNLDGTYTILGTSFSSDIDLDNNKGLMDYWVFSIDEMGEILWSKTYGGSQEDFATQLIKTQDNGYLLGGYSHSIDHDVPNNWGEKDFWVVKITNTGEIQWSKNFGGSEWDELYGLCETESGNFGLSGYTYSSDGDVSELYGDVDIWVVKLDAAGNMLWERNYGSSGTDEGYSISAIGENFLVAGMTVGDVIDYDITEGIGGGDMWFFKLDANGDLICQKVLGDIYYDRANVIQSFIDDKFLVAGHFEHENPTGQPEDINFDFWVIYFADAEMSTEELNQKSISIYPNPVKNNLFFSEELRDIEIYNSLGQKIRNFEKGTHINLSSLPKGTYLLKAKSSSQKSIQHTFIKH
ncbi:T9SS type A sorting domain-containing protein [Moheibacter stercoris]|uniref:Secretion system C-terminal sorting domain-containing protein n=1 Tax=Moheibacter stercoris TaxID=1628251 RepID=A0ABV2LQZ7_9FLAO